MIGRPNSGKFDTLEKLIIVQQAFDAISTPYLINRGYKELNPLIGNIANDCGKMALFKTAITYPIISSVRKEKKINKNDYKKTTIFLNALTGVATLNNLYHIIKNK